MLLRSANTLKPSWFDSENYSQICKRTEFILLDLVMEVIQFLFWLQLLSKIILKIKSYLWNYDHGSLD